MVRFNSNRFFLSTNVVGFVGLGQMGNSMAHNLLKKGKKLVLFDINPACLKEFEQFGSDKVSFVNSPKAVAEKASAVMTMIPTSSDSLKVFLDKETGLIVGNKPGNLYMNSSTISPEVSRQISSQIEKVGSVALDTPVSGSTPAAKAGTLSFMVGGPKESYERAVEYLKLMGNNFFHVGDYGQGLVAKLCNNLILAIHMAGVSESLNMGIKSGVDPKQLLDIINVSSGQCWTTTVYPPVPGINANIPPSNDYKGGFYTKLILKDIRLALELENKLNLPSFVTSRIEELYSELSKTKNYNDLDFSSMFKFISEK